MTLPLRIVIDTNVLVSTALTRGGVPSLAVDRAVRCGVLLLTEATYAELTDVLGRPGLRKYLSARRRDAVLAQVRGAAVFVEVHERLAACRDPKDDKFLDAAVSGSADGIVTGDADLLVLHPFRGIPVLTPAAFLEQVRAET